MGSAILVPVGSSRPSFLFTHSSHLCLSVSTLSLLLTCYFSIVALPRSVPFLCGSCRWCAVFFVPSTMRCFMRTLPAMTLAHVTTSLRACSTSSSRTDDSIPVVPGKVRVRVRDPSNTPPGEPDTYTYSFDEGKSLMECLRDDTDEIDVVGACNGTCKCSTCHVYVGQDWVTPVAKLYPPDDFELDLLSEAAEARDSSRLSCQITLTEALNGLEVEIPSVLEDVRFSRMMKKPK